MRKILMGTLALFAAGQLCGQPGILETRKASDGGRLLTMEETILSPDLKPENREYVWLPEKSYYSFVDDNVLKCGNAKTNAYEDVLSLEELNSIASSSFSSFPAYSWRGTGNILVADGNRFINIDLEGKRQEYSFELPENASNVAPSPAGDMFAFTDGNNLYLSDIDGNVTAVTADSDRNIVNGQFVSRHEFSTLSGIFWSGDGKKLAFYRKDESNVGEFPLLDINTRTGSLMLIKYPMAGMPSEHVSLGIYDLASGKTVFIAADDFGKEQYLTNPAWTPDGELLLVQVLDRAQKHMRLNAYDTSTGEFVRTLLEEENPCYVEPLDPVVFLKSDPGKFIYRTDNRDGYRNLYICSVKDGKIERFTDVDADVAYVGQDSKHIYYTSAEISPVENHLFRKGIRGGKPRQLTMPAGWHDVKLSADGKYFIDSYSSVNVPRVINITSTDLNASSPMLLSEDPSEGYAFAEIDFGTVKSADGKYDNYYRLIKPLGFDSTKKYPLVVYVYGGPHSQLVKNTWLAELRMWEMYMAQRGYIVYVQDNRGTFNRGAAFEKAIYGQCGQAEMADQMEGVKMLMSLPYVDTERIGVHGWSYGGFMTISLITNYPEIFKVAVAGGPVIDWKWYEVMYGERYMGSPDENAAGYEKVSLLPRAKDLKGKLLICQGAVDDVVVWQHSLNFIRECIVNNVQVDYFPYPCAQHNVMGKDRVHLMDKVTMYFDDYLKTRHGEKE